MKYNKYIWLFICSSAYLLISTSAFAQQNKIDSLLTVLKTAKEDTNKVNTLNDLSWQLNLTGSYYSALLHAENAKHLAGKINFKRGTAKAYNIIGNVYQNQGNYPDALENHFAALKIREEIGDKRGIAMSYNNIGIVYYEQGNYPDALENYLASLKIKKDIGDKRGIANSYNNIGNVNYAQGNYPDALKNYFACLKIMEELGDKRGIANSYNNIGNVYDVQSNYPDALKNYFAALKIREEIGDKQGIATSCNNIGNVYVALNNPKDGMEYLNKGLLLSKGIGSKDDIKESYNGLAAADSAMGNNKSAYTNYKMYIVYRDSLLNEENTKKTVQQQMQYEFDKTQTADSIKNVEELKQEELRHTQEIQQQRTYTYGGVIGFALMLVVAGVSFKAYKQKQKANEIISEQKKMVEEKQKEILDSIHYAKRIQQSLLPTEKYIDRSLKKLAKKV